LAAALLGLGILGVSGGTVLEAPAAAEKAAEAKPEASGSSMIQSKYPQPTTEELSKAEKLFQEVYGQQLRATKTPSEQARLAQELLRLAKEDTVPAQKYLLAQKAKELAVRGLHSKLAALAAEVLAEFELPGGPFRIEEAFQKGDALWEESLKVRGRERLALQADAAVWYIAGLKPLPATEQPQAEGRMKEMGWNCRIFEFHFNGNSSEGWQPVQHFAKVEVRNGCLTGVTSRGDPFFIHTNVCIPGHECSTIEIRMAISNCQYVEFFWDAQLPPRWILGWKEVSRVQGDGQFHVYRIDVSKYPTWRQNIIRALRFDPGDWDHRLPRSEQFAIDYIIGLR
jgi:hypothetical protein